MVPLRPALLAAALALSGCLRPAHEPAAPAPDPRLRAAERQVFELVNTYRVHRGLRPLVHNRQLEEVARLHSREMAAGRAPFSHEGLEERFRRVSRELSVLELGENLYAEQPASPRAAWRAVAAWLESAAHREAIEGCFELTGVGVAVDAEGRIYYTQLFARREPPPWRLRRRLHPRRCPPTG